MVRRGRTTERDYLVLPFGYYLERDAGMPMLRRPDCSIVAAFSAIGADPFEVEAAV
jgi:hypothetical protein